MSSSVAGVVARFFAILVVGIATVMPATAFGGKRDLAVGFQTLNIPNGAEPPLVAGVWYPTRSPTSPQRLEAFDQDVAVDGRIAGDRLPLVVLSHGGGGSFAGHLDTALALARAGFVVAAVSHAGDTYDDESRVLELWRRPQQLRRLVSYVLDAWSGRSHLDRARVGAFGFSNGGFTVLVAAGGVPDLQRIGPYCRSHPSHDLCVALAGVPADRIPVPPADAWVADPRIKAIVVAAPAFGFTFGAAGLAEVRVPVQLWRADDDIRQPAAWYDEAVRDALPRPPDYRVVPNANHFAFLAPCSARLAEVAPRSCTDPAGFDRVAFHDDMNARIAVFLRGAFASKRVVARHPPRR